MPKDLFDGQSIEIPCTGCGKKAEKSIAWIRANDRYTCEGCGVEIILERDNLLAGLDEANERAAKFMSDITSGFNKR
ncbi:hypothetical protein BH10PSE10_BH10PSE10_21900 [soil metagenome]